MLRLLAPAKLNLYLRVLGRRPDGYHVLDTVFERLDLADELTFDPHPSGLLLHCSDPSLSCGEDNLILRAARLLQQATGTQLGARIHLVKRIPVAAGLGGGSSDAAATLLGLNRLWDIGLNQSTLLGLAAQLGSDVPFFLLDAPFAVGRGRGDQCEAVLAPATLAHVLVVPPVQLATREVYAGFDQTLQQRHVDPSTGARDRILSSVEGFDLTAPKPSSTMVRHALRNGSLSELATGLWNDLEPEAIRRCPVIATSQLHLRALDCLGTRVSGSGPSVFGLCRDVSHAHAIAEGLPALLTEAGAGAQDARHPWRVEVVQTLHRTEAPAALPGQPTRQTRSR